MQHDIYPTQLLRIAYCEFRSSVSERYPYQFRAISTNHMPKICGSSPDHTKNIKIKIILTFSNFH